MDEASDIDPNNEELWTDGAFQDLACTVSDLMYGGDLAWTHYRPEWFQKELRRRWKLNADRCDEQAKLIGELTERNRAQAQALQGLQGLQTQ